MGETALVELDLAAGQRIISSLDKAGIQVAVAMWVHFAEYEDWRLVLAAKHFDKLSLGDAYLKVNRILSEDGMSAWEVPTIFLMKSGDPFIRALRKVFGKAASVNGMRLGGQTWGDRYIDDAVVYKIA